MNSTRAHQLLRIGTLAVLATPLIFGTAKLFPFVTYRTYFFLLAVDLLALFALRISALRFEALRVSRILQAFMAVLLIKAVTDIAGLGFWASFWGNYERMMGLLLFIHLLLFILLLVSAFPTRESSRAPVRVLALVGTLAAAYGLLQKFHIAFRVSDIDDRLFSTVGNPAFLAGMLLLTLTATALALHEEQRTRYRFAWGAGLILQAAALYFTATRGALLGFGIGCVALALWAFFFPRMLPRYRAQRVRLAAGLLLVVLMLCPIFLRLSHDNSFVQSRTTLRRLADISLQDFSTASRLLIWRTALVAARSHLLLGYGENHIGLALDRFFDSRLREPWFDSTHNVWLDMLLAHGILALAAYVTFIILLFRGLIRHRTENPASAALVTAGLVAYVAQSFFIFDTLVVLVPLCVFIAYAIVLELPREMAPATARAYRVAFWIAAFAVLCLAAGYLRSWRVLGMVSRAKHDLQTQPLSQTTADLRGLEQTAVMGYGNVASVIRDITLAAFASPGVSPQQLQQLLGVMDEWYQLAKDREGLYSRYLVDPAKVRLDAPKALVQTSEILALLEQARALSPRRIDIVYAEIQAYVQAGMYDNAHELLESVRPQFPEIAGELLFKRAQIELIAGRYPDSLQSLEESIAAGWTAGRDYLNWFRQGFIKGGYMPGITAVEQRIDALQ